MVHLTGKFPYIWALFSLVYLYGIITETTPSCTWPVLPFNIPRNCQAKIILIRDPHLSTSLLHNTAGHDGSQHLYRAHHDRLLVRAQLQADGLRCLLEDGASVHQDHEVTTRLLWQHHVYWYPECLECCFVLDCKDKMVLWGWMPEIHV